MGVRLTVSLMADTGGSRSTTYAEAMMAGRVITTLAVALVISTQAVAGQAGHQHGQQQNTSGMMQQHMMSGGMMMCMDMMGSGMGMGMGMAMSGEPGPSAILQAADALALTEQQKTRLDAIQTQHAEAVAPHMEQAMAAHHRAAATLEGDQPDMATYEAALKDAMEHMVAVHVAATRAGLDARAILTADQRTELTNAMTIARGMMCGAAGGTMHHGRGM